MRRAIILVLGLVLVIGTAVQVTATGLADPTCPGSLPNQLTMGMRGQITERFSTLRSKPGGSGAVIAAPARFTVLEAPQCAESASLWWLHIRYDGGQEGWAPESQLSSIYGADHYWLTPVLEAESFG